MHTILRACSHSSPSGTILRESLLSPLTDYRGRRIDNIFSELLVGSLDHPTCEILDQIPSTDQQGGRIDEKSCELCVALLLRTINIPPSQQFDDGSLRIFHLELSL